MVLIAVHGQSSINASDYDHVLLVQWREASYTSETSLSVGAAAADAGAGDVLRVYTVCTSPLLVPRRPVMTGVSSQASVSAAAAVVDNWLRTPWISLQDARRLYVDVQFTMRRCPPSPAAAAAGTASSSSHSAATSHSHSASRSTDDVRQRHTRPTRCTYT